METNTAIGILTNKELSYILLKHSAEIQGLCIYQEFGTTENNFVRLDYFCTKDKLQRQGKWMMKFFLHKMTDMRHEDLFASVDPEVVEFYEKFKFYGGVLKHVKPEVSSKVTE